MFDQTRLTPSDLTSAINLLEQYRAEEARLNNVIAFLSADITRKHNEKQAMKRHLEAYIDSEDIEIEDGTDFEALCSMFDIEATEEAKFKITATWYVTATIKRNEDADDWINSQDFSAELDTNGMDPDYISPEPDYEIEVQD